MENESTPEHDEIVLSFLLDIVDDEALGDAFDSIFSEESHSMNSLMNLLS